MKEPFGKYSKKQRRIWWHVKHDTDKGGRDTKDIKDTRRENESGEVMTVLDRARREYSVYFQGLEREEMKRCRVKMLGSSLVMQVAMNPGMPFIMTGVNCSRHSNYHH